MAMSQNDISPSNMAGSLVDEFGGSMVNLLLGGMLLWVGQTTFEHNGELAGVHQQLEDISRRHQILHERHDTLLDSLNQRTQGRFTADDGDKLAKRIDAVQLSSQSLREQWQDRLAELRIQVSALEVQLQSSPYRLAHAGKAHPSQEVETMQTEMKTLRNEVSRLSRAISAVYRKNEPQIQPAASGTTNSRQASFWSPAAAAH